MRVGLFGQFGGGNLGNDGSLEAMLITLLRTAPEAELVCLCPNPKAIESRFDISSVPTGLPDLTGLMRLVDHLTLGSLRRASNLVYPFVKMRKYDLVIVPGTGFLDDFKETPFGWPFLTFRWCLAARLSGAKLAFVSIGAGPIANPISRWFMKWSGRMCHFRSFRDSASRDFLHNLKGARESDRVSADLVFRLPSPVVHDPNRMDGITVGIGVMSYSGWVRGAACEDAVRDCYLARMSAFIGWLMDGGHSIRLLIGETSDESAVLDLLQRLRCDKGAETASVAYEPAVDMTDLMRQIGKTDVVVGSRFHNIVAGLKMHKPVISLGYASKNLALLADMGLQGFSQHIEQIDLEKLKSQFAEALANRAVLQERIAEGVARYDAVLGAQDRVLHDLLAWSKIGGRCHDLQHKFT